MKIRKLIDFLFVSLLLLLLYIIKTPSAFAADFTVTNFNAETYANPYRHPKSVDFTIPPRLINCSSLQLYQGNTLEWNFVIPNYGSSCTLNHFESTNTDALAPESLANGLVHIVITDSNGVSKTSNDFQLYDGQFPIPSPLPTRPYTLTDIVTLPGDAESMAIGINNSGQIAGLSAITAVEGCDYFSSTCGYHAFTYSNGVMTDIGNLSGGVSSYGININNLGTVVGFASAPNTLEQAFVYINGVMTSLGNLSGGSHSIAYGINDSNQVVGWADIADGSRRAFLYNNGVMTDIGTLPGDGQAELYNINNINQIVGWSYPTSSPAGNCRIASGDCPYHAFLYSGGTFTPLGTLPGGTQSKALDINDNGQIVGSSNTANTPIHAFFYNNGTMTDLGTLPGGTQSQADHINSSGQIVGISDMVSGQNHPFLYSNGVMADLNLLIPVTSGWNLIYAFGINSSGQIVGMGTYNGIRHGFSMSPINNNTPVVGQITVSSNPTQVNISTNASASFTDADITDTHTASWKWGDGNTTVGTVSENNGSGSVTDSHTYTAAGVYTVALTVTDSHSASGTSQYQYVVVYDPSVGFLTGSGKYSSQSGWDMQNASATGDVKFGIQAKYTNGNTPTGQSKLNFKVGNLDFNSASYEWLVVNGAKAVLKADGTVNGLGSYTLLVSAIDGGQTNGQNLIRFQIRDASNTVIYDTQPGDPSTADPTTAISNGSIKVH